LVQPGREVSFAGQVPGAIKPSSNQVLIVPAYHMFGSDMLGRYTKGIQDRSPEPYVLMNTKDAGRLGFTAGQKIKINLCGKDFELELKLAEHIAEGAAAVPAGLPGLPWDGTPFIHSFSEVPR
jgi:NADH-quinone oxidoreductase subunit G